MGSPKTTSAGRYQYLSIRDGRIVACLDFDTRKEALAFFAEQSAGIGPSDSWRMKLVKNGRGFKTLRDTWWLPGEEVK
jgi:hypothetical protein